MELGGKEQLKRCVILIEIFKKYNCTYECGVLLFSRSLDGNLLGTTSRLKFA